MYDRQTESWWQQATGDAIVGEYTGRRLAFVPALMTAWDEFKSNFPDGIVLSRETGFQRAYGRNPYGGYDDVDGIPWLFSGQVEDGQLPPMARVITVDLGDEARAYPYDILQELQVVNDVLAGTPVVIVWVPGTASALDASTVAGGRDVGSAAAYSRLLEGEELSFTLEGEMIVDGTGTEWNVLGQAVNGPLEGSQLEPVVSINHFWFSWAAFRPDTTVYQPQ